MKLIERAAAHYESKGLLSVSVEEWGEPGQPAVIYFRPITVVEHSLVFKSDRALSDRLYVQLIVMKALDADGKRVFADADEFTLTTKADGNIVKRIGIAMLASIPSVEDHIKN